MSLLCCLFVVALGATVLISFNKLELQLSGCQGLVSVFTGRSVGPEEQQQLACDRGGLPFPRLSSLLRMANSSTPLWGMLALVVRLPCLGRTKLLSLPSLGTSLELAQTI